jgi:hypothetical protein
MRAASSIAPALVSRAGERALDGERGVQRALGVVLLGARIAEQGHQPVADLFQHVAAEACYAGGGLVEIGVDEIAPILGVELRREARRADEIAEHHGDRAALGGRLRTSRRRRLRRRCGRVHRRRGDSESGDGREQSHPVADRGNANVLEVIRRQLRQNVRVDLVVPEIRLVMAEAETAKPPRHVHGSRSTRLDGSVAQSYQPVQHFGRRWYWGSGVAPGQSTPLSLNRLYGGAPALTGRFGRRADLQISR